MQWACSISSAVGIYFVVAFEDSLFRRMYFGMVPYVVFAFCVKEYGVFDVSVSASLEVLGVTLYTSDFVSEVFAPEDFVHHDFDVVSYLYVGVNVKGADVAEEVA